jgi:hypothetical protein
VGVAAWLGGAVTAGLSGVLVAAAMMSMSAATMPRTQGQWRRFLNLDGRTFGMLVVDGPVFMAVPSFDGSTDKAC